MSSNMGAVAQTKQYPGDALFAAGEYDHVFDVELGDGIMRKLPFNNGGMHLEAAEKFCIREGISRTQVEQIVDFLRKHALPYKTRDIEQPDNLQKANVKSTQNKPSQVPMTKPLYFEQVNVDGPKKKIMSFAEEFEKLITYKVQFEGLCDILAMGISHKTPDIGS
jgi:phospholipase A-2-activating protein